MILFLKLKNKIKYLFRKRLKISSNFIHTQISDYYYSVDLNDVIKYNDAVKNDNHQISSEQKNLHPLYYTKISWKIIENLNEFLKTRIDDKILNTIVHQSEYIIFHSELKIPAKLNVQSKIWSIKAHKKGTKMLIRFDYYSDNELIATEYSGGLLFGVKYIGESESLGELPKNIKLNGPVRWKKTIDIDKLLPYKYAEKAEIDAPIHTNPKFAKTIGLPSIILQGTCTFAKAINLLIHEKTDKNYAKIQSVSAKFTGMLIPPNKMTVRILKQEKKMLLFDVLNKEEKAVIKGGQIIFC